MSGVKWTWTVVVLLALVTAGPAVAVIETYEFSEPALEARYQLLSAELRCPKCQNQNIADSDAPIAKDLRQLLHQQLEAGASDEAILDYMVARYGEFVRYRPRMAGATLVLWVAPLALLLLAVGVLVFILRSRSSAGGASDPHSGAGLSAEDASRVDALLQSSASQDTDAELPPK